MLNKRDSLLSGIDAAILELVSKNGTNRTADDSSEVNFNDDSLIKEEELLEVDDNIGNPNRSRTSSSPFSSLEQKLSSSESERVEKLERSFIKYMDEKGEERERAFEAWLKENDSKDRGDAATLDWEEEQSRLEDEVFDMDLKLEPLKTRFPKFRKAIGTS